MRGVDKTLEDVSGARRHLSHLWTMGNVPDKPVVKQVLVSLADLQMEIEELFEELEDKEEVAA